MRGHRRPRCGNVGDLGRPECRNCHLRLIGQPLREVESGQIGADPQTAGRVDRVLHAGVAWEPVGAVVGDRAGDRNHDAPLGAWIEDDDRRSRPFVQMDDEKRRRRGGDQAWNR